MKHTIKVEPSYNEKLKTSDLRSIEKAMIANRTAVVLFNDILHFFWLFRYIYEARNNMYELVNKKAKCSEFQMSIPLACSQPHYHIYFTYSNFVVMHFKCDGR